ncbi:MAG: hypothetical protein HOP09_11195 [Hyphomicrobium sp.]|nr:hypothetical protein [Hyphomicrobium sp.]
MITKEPAADTPIWLIDGPSFFAPMQELLAWQQECEDMLRQYPAHPQWQSELDDVTKTIAACKEIKR